MKQLKLLNLNKTLEGMFLAVHSLTQKEQLPRNVRKALKRWVNKSLNLSSYEQGRFTFSKILQITPSKHSAVSKSMKTIRTA